MFIVDRSCETQLCTGCNDTEYCTFCFCLAHPSKSCIEVERISLAARNPKMVAEEALAEVVIRTCPKCHVRFVKDGGCNKITCSTPGCDTMICYICKQQVGGYDHFCCNGSRQSPDQPCPDPDCDKKCILHMADEVIIDIEKKWTMEAGRSALAAHGVSDPRQIEDILASILIS